jgi:hypothetical protein
MTNFQPGQILYLEYHSSRLYTEVIQVVEARGICWVRPIALIVADEELITPSSPQLQAHNFYRVELEGTCYDHPVLLYDLRQSSDLLYPAKLFNAAIDIEVIPILAILNARKNAANSASLTDEQCYRQLQIFVHQLWSIDPAAFQS